MPMTQTPPAREISQRAPDNIAYLDPTQWRKIQAIVRESHPGLYRQWFEQLSAQPVNNGLLQINVNTAAQLNYCQHQCQMPFTTAAQQVFGRLIAVGFHCPKMPRGGVYNEGDQPLLLSPDYAFEHFVVGPCNRLAHAASIAVSDAPGKSYNPLFIHGGVGLGKTHLLHAICQNILEKSSDKRILFLSCDSFVNQFIQAVQQNDMNNFRHRYRHADVLVIDDIHFLRGHERTQEEFFHTFNTLYQANKQIILSADAPPSEIPELEERLVSRFNWGLVARVDKPGYETRIAILRQKAKMRGLELPDDVVSYVGLKVENNIRELEGIITRLEGMSRFTQGRIDMDVAREALGDSASPEKKRITIQQILEVVTRYYNVKVSDLQSKRRHRSIAFPRQVCMYLARKYTRYSLEEVGGYFGNRDHTTVLHAVRTIESDIKNEAGVADQLNQIEIELK